MNFKRIELVGFKSFADKTVVDFNDGITQDVQSVLYIIRPSGHDHTFCVAKHGDKFFFSDDIHIRGTLLRAINNPVGLDTNQGFNFVYEDMYDNLTGGKTHYNFNTKSYFYKEKNDKLEQHLPFDSKKIFVFLLFHF